MGQAQEPSNFLKRESFYLSPSPNNPKFPKIIWISSHLHPTLQCQSLSPSQSLHLQCKHFVVHPMPPIFKNILNFYQAVKLALKLIKCIGLESVNLIIFLIYYFLKRPRLKIIHIYNNYSSSQLLNKLSNYSDFIQILEAKLERNNDMHQT